MKERITQLHTTNSSVASLHFTLTPLQVSLSQNLTAVFTFTFTFTSSQYIIYPSPDCLPDLPIAPPPYTFNQPSQAALIFVTAPALASKLEGRQDGADTAYQGK